MNSIINPWVFYWIGIVDSIRTLLIAILIVLVIVVAIMFMCTMSDADDYGFKNKNVVEEAKTLHQGCNCNFCCRSSGLCGSF